MRVGCVCVCMCYKLFIANDISAQMRHFNSGISRRFHYEWIFKRILWKIPLSHEIHRKVWRIQIIGLWIINIVSDFFLLLSSSFPAVRMLMAQDKIGARYIQWEKSWENLCIPFPTLFFCHAFDNPLWEHF